MADDRQELVLERIHLLEGLDLRQLQAFSRHPVGDVGAEDEHPLELLGLLEDRMQEDLVTRGEAPFCRRTVHELGQLE
ncbi:hypothetical protein D3C86_1926740 [compost metagenome]